MELFHLLLEAKKAEQASVLLAQIPMPKSDDEYIYIAFWLEVVLKQVSAQGVHDIVREFLLDYDDYYTMHYAEIERGLEE